MIPEVNSILQMNPDMSPSNYDKTFQIKDGSHLELKQNIITGGFLNQEDGSLLSGFNDRY
jgi:hypothetical protein